MPSAAGAGAGGAPAARGGSRGRRAGGAPRARGVLPVRRGAGGARCPGDAPGVGEAAGAQGTGTLSVPGASAVPAAPVSPAPRLVAPGARASGATAGASGHRRRRLRRGQRSERFLQPRRGRGFAGAPLPVPGSCFPRAGAAGGGPASPGAHASFCSPPPQQTLPRSWLPTSARREKWFSSLHPSSRERQPPPAPHPAPAAADLEMEPLLVARRS